MREVRDRAFLISLWSSRFWSPGVLSWRVWFPRTSTGSTNKKGLTAGSCSAYSLQPRSPHVILTFNYMSFNHAIKISQQMKLKHRHVHVKISLQKCSWSTWVMHQLTNWFVFVWFFPWKIIFFLMVRFYLWVPVHWAVSVRQLWKVGTFEFVLS